VSDCHIDYITTVIGSAQAVCRKRERTAPAPTSAIGDQLGFDEATNFVKFFRRETGMTPGAFRTRQASG
jgi:AraC-like DNA-binding protein